MDATNPSETNLTLLGRIRAEPTDQKSWDEFVARYGGKIKTWCRRWGLQEADADEVVQNVMLTLSSQMRRFEYNPSSKFRSWLKTVAFRACRKYLDKWKRNASPADTQVLDRLLSDEAETDFQEQLEQEYKSEVMQLAMQRVEPRVKSHTWQAFALTTQAGVATEDAAQQLGISSGQVYVARFRVQKMLMEEVENIEDADEL